MHHFRICSVLTLLLALATIPLCLDAQKREFPQPKLPADPKIAAALKEISPQQIQGTIEKLVSFGTRLRFPHRIQVPLQRVTGSAQHVSGLKANSTATRTIAADASK